MWSTALSVMTARMIAPDSSRIPGGKFKDIAKNLLYIVFTVVNYLKYKYT